MAGRPSRRPLSSSSTVSVKSVSVESVSDWGVDTEDRGGVTGVRRTLDSVHPHF